MMMMKTQMLPVHPSEIHFWGKFLIVWIHCSHELLDTYRWNATCDTCYLGNSSSMCFCSTITCLAACITAQCGWSADSIASSCSRIKTSTGTIYNDLMLMKNKCEAISDNRENKSIFDMSESIQNRRLNSPFMHMYTIVQARFSHAILQSREWWKKYHDKNEFIKAEYWGDVRKKVNNLNYEEELKTRQITWESVTYLLWCHPNRLLPLGRLVCVLMHSNLHRRHCLLKVRPSQLLHDSHRNRLRYYHFWK